MKRTVTELIIFISSLLIMGIFGAIYSLIIAGVVGWGAIGIAPQASYKMVENFVCPSGSNMRYSRSPVTTSGPSNANDSVSCVLPDKVILDGVKPRAVSRVIKVFFFVCFIPTFLAGTVLMWFTMRRWSQKFSELDHEVFA